jgi:DNA invertase Pin-like site-specific DNA recombinase
LPFVVRVMRVFTREILQSIEEAALVDGCHRLKSFWRVRQAKSLRDRLSVLGWFEIEVIDDDLGRSAAGGVQRAGFERMVAEVCLGKVGAVCAREVSRFARNSRDWQQLIEMCRVVDTVLIDQETVYAPRHGNDRLLLGLKGSLNKYELNLLRQRSLSARYEKARRACGERPRRLREGRRSL